MRARLAGLAAFLTAALSAGLASSRLDPSSFDPSVRPQDDLYRYVNGRWLAGTPIPDDRVTYGVFAAPSDQVELDLRTVIEEAAPTLQRLMVEMPGFDWIAWARPQGLEGAAAIAVLQPSFFSAFAALTAEQPLDRWKAWLAARYISAMAPNLSKGFVDARFELFGRVLTGQSQPRPRWKIAVGDSMQTTASRGSGAVRAVSG